MARFGMCARQNADGRDALPRVRNQKPKPPRDAAGNALTGRLVTWTTGAAGVATVNGSGLVTAVAAGTATITATSEGKTGTATVAVAQVPVATVSVTPSSLSLTGGQTGQLTATPRDAAGNTLTGRVVTWVTNASAVATVSASGLVTAQGVGTATIMATSEGKSGTATVTVTGGSGGGAVLFAEGFEDGSFGSRGWYDNTAMTTTTAEAKSGSRSLEVRWMVGASNPTFGLGARHLFTATGAVYLSYWVKYSTNWVGSGLPYHPHEFSFVTTEDDQYVGPAYTHLTTYVEHNYQNGGIPVLAMQDGKNIDVSRIGQDLTGVTEGRAAAGCNGNTDGYATDCYAVGGGLYNNAKTWKAAQPAFLPTPGPGYKNDWHFVEVYFQLNTIRNGVGQPDGIARYWVDGQLMIEHTNVLFRTGVHGTMQFNQFLLSFYMDSSPVDQTMWVDDLTIATAKP